jgi:anti-sigma factor (TIGR02949 family)
MTCDDAAGVLDPYVDGELAPDEAASFLQHVETCAACRDRLERRRALRRAVRRVPYHAAPERLRSAVAAAVAAAPPRRSIRPLLAWAAMLLLGVSLGATGAVLLRRTPRSGASEVVTEAVVDAHVRALMGDHLLDVPSSDLHTVKPWFVGKIDFAPPVTDLSADGFALAGGRLDYVAGRPAAALVYRRRLHTIDLFVWPDDAGGPETSAAVRGFNVRQWSRGGMAFRAVSDLGAEDLAAFVRALQR